MILAICSNVWNVADFAIFYTFSGDFTKNVKTVGKPREISFFLAFWSIFVDALSTVDNASTKQAFFELCGHQA
jgi:hypothetical protein